MSCSKNRKIYIVLTYTGTILSKIIKYYTKAEYSHVSIALDENLNKMYSFGRLNAYNPFVAGFVREGINFGTFKRFKNTKASIYSVDLTNEQYKKLKRILKKICKRKDIYKFNLIGLLAVAFKKKIKRNNYFYCSEFIKYLIEESKIELKLPDLVKPNDFKNIDGLTLTYNGVLRDYGLFKI